MELRQLRYFVAVAEELHFRRAGERLHVAQPAVSEQIRKLELELGVQLFARSTRNVALTASGAAMLDEARRALSQAEAAGRAARDAHGRELGRLRIGYLPDVLPPAVPRLLRRLSATAPRVSTTLQTGSARRLLQDVREQRIDAAIVCVPAPVAGLRVVSLGEEETVAAVPEDHPCARQPVIELGGLERTRFVQLARAVNPAFHDAVLSACRAAGLAPEFTEVAEPSVENVLLSVASGAGVALLPASAEERFATPGVRFRPLAPPAPSHRVVLAVRTDANATIAALVRAAGETARPHRRLRSVA